MKQTIHVFVVLAKRAERNLSKEIGARVPDDDRIVSLATMQVQDAKGRPGVTVTMVTEPTERHS